MEYGVVVRNVDAAPLAAVRRRMPVAQIPEKFSEALDQVWQFLARHPELRRDGGGHNVFLYHHDMDRDGGGALTIDFGVQVARPFEPDGEVFCAMTPAGEVAATTHRGSYNRLPAAHRAVHETVAESGWKMGGLSWEIYGDWYDDPAKLSTEVVYLLQPEARHNTAPG
jgi:effector-binding domain-containing protein